MKRLPLNVGVVGTAGRIRATALEGDRGADWRRRIESPQADERAEPTPVLHETATTGGFSFLLFCLLTFVIVGRPNDYIPALVPLRLALVGTALTVLATLAQRSPGGPVVFQLRESKLYLAFYAAMCIGVPFAMHRRVSFEQAVTLYASNIIYFFLFVTHVTSRRRFRRVLEILVFGGLVFSLVGLQQGRFRFDRLDIVSQMYDPNDVAFVEIALVSFALAILLPRSSLVRRLLALTSALFGVLVALYTGSRGGLLGLITFVVLFISLSMAGVKKIYKGLLLVMLAGAAVLNADKINIERYMTLTNLGNDYNVSDEWGRTDVWKTGIVMFLHNPLTGVGAGNFAMAIGNRRQALGEVPKWQAPHNAFIQVLTEVGIFGIAAWIMLVGCCVKTLWRLRRLDNRSDGGEMALWANALFIGFVAQLVSAFFLSMAYSVFFTLFFAISTSLRLMAGTSEGGVAVPALPKSPRRLPRLARVT